MLNRIIKFSLDNRVVVLAGAVLLMAAGTYTASRMDVDVFPDLNAPTVVVMTEAAGMAPEEVERLVTFPVETAVNGAADVRRLRSSSTTGFSVVWVEFEWGTDIYRARQTVAEKLAAVSGELPPGVGRPVLGPQSSILGEVMIIGLTADSTSQGALRTLADWTIRPRLLATGGVAQVSVIGGELEEYQILLDPARMRHHGVSLDEALTATRGMNGNASGGVLYEYGGEYIVRGDISTRDVGELARAVVKRSDYGAPVLLGQIADVRMGAKTPKLGTAAVEGRPAVIMTVTKQPAASTVKLTAALDGALADISAGLPPDVRVRSDIFRQERFIASSIDNVRKSLVEGGIFVVIVLFLFLMNVRTTVISLVTIPLSLVCSILALKWMGLTINTMSLGGMAIAIGSLVDDAIVDVENVYKRLRENRAKSKDEQRPVMTVVYDASREVRMPILNSTLIIIVSFVPLFFLSGMEGRMLAPLGIAFIVALCASTLVALTLTPVLCSYLLGRRQKQEREPWVARTLKRGYGRCLGWALGHKYLVLGATGALVAAAVAMFFSMGSGFLPPFNEGSFTVNVSTLPGISLEESDAIGRRAEELLLSVPEIRTTGRKTGRAELDEHALGVNVSEIEAPFTLSGRSKEEVAAEVRQKLKALPGAMVEIGQPISHRIDAMLSGTRAGISIKLFGPDLNRLFALGGEIKSAVADVPGVADLNVEQQVERPQLSIAPRREMLARHGIAMPEFAEAVRVLLAGEAVSQVYDEGRVVDITLKVADDGRATAGGIRSLEIDAWGGRGKIPLEAVADVTSATGPNTINRENAARRIVVSANATGGDLGGVVREMQRRIAGRVTLPEGYRVEYGGQFESARAASRTLLAASIFSVLVIFLLLWGEFRSFTRSAVVLVNLPLALVGGVAMIFASGGVVSIPAIIGLISLLGIATRNGMLLISRYTDLRAGGAGLRESIVQGSADRLNPILMTALTSALALVPLVWAGDLPGNEIQSPMARVILGGLLTSTLLNGFVVPVMYMITDGRRRVAESANETTDTKHSEL